MAQPIWQTAAGSLGVIPEGVFYQQNLLATDSDLGTVTYSVIAGTLPAGVQCTTTGQIVGVPQASSASLQGVPVNVNQDVTSKFVIRASSGGRIADRTFTLTITGNDAPQFTTPAGEIGTYYDGGQVDLQIEYTDADTEDVAVVTLIKGALPPGLTLSPTGLISGYIVPATPIDQPPGYDLTAVSTEPYDFIVDFVSRNYQFTLEVSDGKSNDVRTFTIFVYARNEITADTTQITADNDFVTADETNTRAPFLTNAAPSDLGSVRSSNYYAYQFIGDDYDSDPISYAISVNEGFGLPPFQNSKTDTNTDSCGLDPETGWLYGYIPDQGTTEVDYSFNITVYQTQGVDSVTCTSTSATNNRITCTDTSALAPQSEWYVSGAAPLYIPIKLSGTALGGLSTAGQTLYYVLYVYSATQFSITASTSSNDPVILTTTSGSMTADVVIASQPYPFNLTIIGAVDSEITWLTDADLGTIVNGETSLLQVVAENRGGRELQYRLLSGAFNSLPQGLELLPSGDIAGRTTFNTFAIDLGATTIDNNTTTWDSEFTFTVNAYAPDTRQTLYNVSSIEVTDGGTGYSSISTPTIVFSTPVGASAVQAIVGNVTVSGGAITAVEVSNPGSGYTGNATITITEGFGGTGGELTAVMQATGTRDVVNVSKTFTLRVIREYNAPYQNLYVRAMPPQNDRELVNSLLSDSNIFPPEYLFRPTDPNFGLSTQVTYQHAFGLAPDALEVYVESLYLNHYWKDLVLGQIETAVARDSNGNIIYEVVYSRIVDNLVNNAGESVSKIVPLPYPITDPADGSSEINVVYPNSLVNMRDQVIDTVGQISTGLPLWMTSKQDNGRVLGFTPAWVIAYVTPGNGKRIAYYLDSQFGVQLNRVDFKVDRYILDRSLSRNWDTTTQDWTPQPSLTTFDRFDTAGYSFIGNVSIATNLAYSDVNERTLGYIAGLGGLDGEISQIDGNTLIFVKQENYDGPPGSSYSTTDAGWQDYTVTYDSGPFAPETEGTSFDSSYTVSGGEELECTATSSVTDRVTYTNTTGAQKVYPGLPLTIASPIGGIGTGLHVVLSAPTQNTFTLAKATTVTSVEVSTDLVTITNRTGFAVGDAVMFYQTVFGGLVEGTTYYILTLTPLAGTAAQITLSLTPSGVRETLSAGSGNCLMHGATALALSTDSGVMTATTYNERMAIYQISVDPVTEVVTLTVVDQTEATDYVQISRGSQYRSAQLYIPNVPAAGLNRISWLALTTVVTTETEFDQGSVEFIEPVDMYNPTDSNDKYLVFPKSNILV